MIDQTELFNEIMDLINQGKTIIFSTAWNAIKFNKRLFKSWEKTGLKPLFLSENKKIYMRSGKQCTCLLGCKITIM